MTKFLTTAAAIVMAILGITATTTTTANAATTTTSAVFDTEYLTLLDVNSDSVINNFDMQCMKNVIVNTNESEAEFYYYSSDLVNLQKYLMNSQPVQISSACTANVYFKQKEKVDTNKIIRVDNDNSSIVLLDNEEYELTIFFSKETFDLSSVSVVQEFMDESTPYTILKTTDDQYVLAQTFADQFWQEEDDDNFMLAPPIAAIPAYMFFTDNTLDPNDIVYVNDYIHIEKDGCCYNILFDEAEDIEYLETRYASIDFEFENIQYRIDVCNGDKFYLVKE